MRSEAAISKTPCAALSECLATRQIHWRPKPQMRAWFKGQNATPKQLNARMPAVTCTRLSVPLFNIESRPDLGYAAEWAAMCMPGLTASKVCGRWTLLRLSSEEDQEGHLHQRLAELGCSAESGRASKRDDRHSLACPWLDTDDPSTTASRLTPLKAHLFDPERMPAQRCASATWCCGR